MLDLQNTYMNLAHTNAYVIEKASQEINKNRANNLCAIKLFLELVQQKYVNQWVISLQLHEKIP